MKIWVTLTETGLHLWKIWGSKAITVLIVVSILPLGSSTVCVQLFVVKVHLFSRVYRRGGGGGPLHLSALWGMRENFEETWHALPIFRLTIRKSICRLTRTYLVINAAPNLKNAAFIGRLQEKTRYTPSRQVRFSMFAKSSLWNSETHHSVLHNI